MHLQGKTVDIISMIKLHVHDELLRFYCMCLFSAWQYMYSTCTAFGAFGFLNDRKIFQKFFSFKFLIFLGTWIKFCDECF